MGSAWRGCSGRKRTQFSRDEKGINENAVGGKPLAMKCLHTPLHTSRLVHQKYIVSDSSSTTNTPGSCVSRVKGTSVAMVGW
jgi:hypothetical protein